MREHALGSRGKDVDGTPWGIRGDVVISMTAQESFTQVKIKLHNGTPAELGKAWKEHAKNYPATVKVKTPVSYDILNEPLFKKLGDLD